MITKPRQWAEIKFDKLENDRFIENYQGWSIYVYTPGENLLAVIVAKGQISYLKPSYGNKDIDANIAQAKEFIDSF